MTRQAEIFCQFRIIQKSLERVDKALGIRRIESQGAFAGNLRCCRTIGADDRASQLLRLQHRQAEAFIGGGDAKAGCVTVKFGQLPVIYAGKPDQPGLQFRSVQRAGDFLRLVAANMHDAQIRPFFTEYGKGFARRAKFLLDVAFPTASM